MSFGRAYRSLLLPALLIGFSVSAPVALAKKSDIPNRKDVRIGEIFKFRILKTRPTQPAVGMRAVEEKVDEYEKMSEEELRDFLKNNPIPVVRGPDGNFYMIDHHHQSLAALKSGRKNAYYELVADYSRLKGMRGATFKRKMRIFWDRMKKQKWVRAFNAMGEPIKIPGGLPLTIEDVIDDPYRSLAYYIRKEGAYSKTDVEFAEFLWADFFRYDPETGRPRVYIGTTKKDFFEAVKRAVARAREEDAMNLPGWKGDPQACGVLFKHIRVR